MRRLTGLWKGRDEDDRAIDNMGPFIMGRLTSSSAKMKFLKFVTEMLQMEDSKEFRMQIFSAPLVEATINVIAKEKRGSNLKLWGFEMLSELAAGDKEPIARKLFVFPTLVDEALKSVKEEAKGSDNKGAALRLLLNIVADDATETLALFSSHEWLLPTLLAIAKEEKRGSEVKQRAFALLALAAEQEPLTLRVMSMPELLDEAVRSVREEDKGSDVKMEAFRLLAAFTQQENDTEQILLYPELMKMTVRVVREEEKGSKAKLEALGLLLNLSVKDDVGVRLFETPGLPEAIKSVFDDEPPESEMVEYVMAVVNNFAFIPSVRERLLRMKFEEPLHRVLAVTATDMDTAEAKMNAMLALAVLYGNDEEKSKTLRGQGIEFQYCVTQLLMNINGQGKEAVFEIRDVLVPFLSLARLPANRPYLDSTTSILTVLTSKALPYLLHNDDHKNFDTAVAILSQFTLDEDKSFLKRFMADSGLRRVLESARARAASPDSPAWATVLPQIDGLLWALNDEAAERLKRAPSSVLDPAGELQVMVSYNWASSKTQAKAVEEFLAKRGIRTWIDEKKMKENPMAAMGWFSRFRRQDVGRS